MNILHLCNDFCDSKVHKNLYRELDRQGVKQTVYTYFYDSADCGKNRFDAQSTEFVYRPILCQVYKFLYHKKLHDVYEDIKSQLLLAPQTFDAVHATTLFSDGGLALRIYKDYGIPYVVSVRNTDVNDFLVRAPHTWATGLRILRSASRIVFISKAHKEKFCHHPLIRTILSSIENKFVVQPNGIDNYWIHNVKDSLESNNRNVLYVGRFNRNKNVKRLCRAVVEMRKQYSDIRLHIVGGIGTRSIDNLIYTRGVENMIRRYPETIIYHGKVYDNEALKDIYSQCSIFAMPSFHETFGLVYLEALTQHLAIVYTKGEGVDGMFDSRIGESVKASSTESIKMAIGKILSNRDIYIASELIDFNQFRWNTIASRYIDIYNNAKTGI